MIELVVNSRASSNLDIQEIEDISNKSYKFNTENNITGCLLYHNHQFLHILEGEEDVIEQLLARVNLDKRHCDMIILMRGNKKERSFNKWNLAYGSINENDLFVKNFIAFSNIAQKPTKATELFWSMAKIVVSN